MIYQSLLALSLSLLPIPITQQPVLVAQVTGCPRAEVISAYETASYRIFICQGFNNYFFYRGVEKDSGASINLTAVGDRQGWQARNGDYLYQINERELVVRQSGKVILREAVIRPR